MVVRLKTKLEKKNKKNKSLLFFVVKQALLCLPILSSSGMLCYFTLILQRRTGIKGREVAANHNAKHRAGVIGLSAALRLQEDGAGAVTIVARDFPGPFETIDPRAQINFTSPWAGAHNRWVPPSEKDGKDGAREHHMSLRTFRRMKELSRSHPEAGISWLKGIEYLEAPPAEYQALTEGRAREFGMDGFRLLRQKEFPDQKVKWGCEYDTWCANPMVYCCFLLRKFVSGGGKIIKRDLRGPQEAFAIENIAPVSIVVNASGNGFGDPNVFITRGKTCPIISPIYAYSFRFASMSFFPLSFSAFFFPTLAYQQLFSGQTCVVSNYCDATVTRQNADGTWTFSVPRNFDGGTVIGGTKEPDNWDAEPSVQVREKLLHAFAATYPSVLGPSGKFEVIRDIVGRRPTRHGGIRLETEEVGGEKAIVHAYGLGGRGYELSWGVAEEVLQHVNALSKSHPKL